MINISRTNDDTFYRYKMPKLLIKNEGKFTGQKTLLLNIDEISASLSRNPSHLFKFIGYALATQAKNNTLNGKHDAGKIQEIIYDFIDHYVMCVYCDNPETFFVVENKDLKKECLACGKKMAVKPHKLNATIIKDVKNSVRQDVYANTNSAFEVKTEVGDAAKSKTNSNQLRKELECVCDVEEMIRIFKAHNIKENEYLEVLLEVPVGILKNCGEIIRALPVADLCVAIENYVVRNNNEDEISRYLSIIEGLGVKQSEMLKHFSKPPQYGKKRSVTLKRSINDYFL